MHFNAVCEQFSPYDTIFEIASADQLTDHKLSAACSLHTASGSTSSAGSSPKKRLVEIAEEDENEVPPTKRKSMLHESEVPKTPKSPSWNTEPVTLNAELAASPEQSKFAAPSTSEVPTFVGAEERPDTGDSFSAADAAQDFGYLGYPYSKPKVKLAPRPSTESRPQTAGNFRPVSAVPSGYKMFGGKNKRTKSKDSSSTQEDLAEFAPNPKDTEDAERPVSSSSKSPTEGNSKKITPEKARLMKAMKLREKKKKQAAAAAAAKEKDEDTAEGGDADAADQQPDKDTEIVAPEASTSHAVTETPAAVDAMSSSTHTEASEAASELDESTNASSISESTDETARAKDDANENEAKSNDAAEAPYSEKAADKGKDTDSVAETVTDKVTDVEAKTEAPVKAAEPQLSLPISKFSPNANDWTEPKTPVDEKKDTQTALPLVASPQDLIAAAKAAAEPVVSTPAVELAQSPLALAGEFTPKDTAKSEPVAGESKEATPTTAQEKVEEVKHADAPKAAVEEVKNVEVKQTEVVKAEDAAVVEEAKEEAKPVAEATKAAEPVKETLDNSDADTISAPAEEQKRKSLVQPIQTETKPEPVGAPPLQQEAQSASTSKSPITPTDETDSATYSVRTTPDPVRGTFVPDGDVSKSSARSVSGGAAYLHKITQQQNNNLSLNKSSVGSSISQRIKALEKLSAKPEGDSRPVSRERPQSTFYSVKRKDPSKGASVLERTNSLRAQTPTAESSEMPRPLERSGTMNNRLSMFQPEPDAPLPTRSDSVMTKIVRDPKAMAQDASGFNPVDLKQSPLFASHQKVAQGTRATPTETQQAENESPEKGRSSISLVRGLKKDKKSPSAGSEEFTSPGASPRPAVSTNSSFSRSPSNEQATEEPRSPGSDPKMSRAGRFMKRLSTLSSSKPKGAAAPAMSAPAEAADGASGAAIAAYLGDVNVQFPDSLLWKRRNMCLDAQGFIVLSALPAQSSRTAQGTKRFHLSEFRLPYTPEVEMQELPNSVVLDFVEGTSLQLACESRHEQVTVLESESYQQCS